MTKAFEHLFGNWTVTITAVRYRAYQDAEIERDRYKAALERISNGEGYYGAQAYEYKKIARAALENRP